MLTMEVPQPAKTALVEEGELMLEVTGTDVDARHAMKTVDEPHSAGPQPAVSHSPQQRRRRTALFATAACLIALLVAGGVAIALVAAGVLNLSSNGGGDGLRDNGEPWVYGKSKYGECRARRRCHTRIRVYITAAICVYTVFK